MVKNMIKKADFQPVTKVSESLSKLMFMIGDVKNPVYDGDGDDKKIVRYEDTDFCDVLVCYYSGEITEAALKKLIADYYNPIIDDKILTGFKWNDMQVWLSSENQFNYKAAFDLAVQTQGTTLPVKFKFGSDDDPKYHEFTTIEELQEFYLSAMQFINQTLNEGWEQKDSFDWSLYVGK